MKKNVYLVTNILNTFREYLENLKYIENGIEEIEQLIESYYNDNRTAYIFTSDHGMTDWGKVFEYSVMIKNSL